MDRVNGNWHEGRHLCCIYVYCHLHCFYGDWFLDRNHVYRVSNLYPAGIMLGANEMMMAGCIVSGAIFGDNLDPISDTDHCFRIDSAV